MDYSKKRRQTYGCKNHHRKMGGVQIQASKQIDKNAAAVVQLRSGCVMILIRLRPDQTMEVCMMTHEDIENRIHIDTEAIPAFRREELVRWAIELTKEVFKRPGAEEEYQAWLKKRKQNTENGV
jgi:hypothetical protein